MTAYQVLFPDHHGDDWEEAYEYEAYNEEAAVNQCCDERYSDWEYPSGPLHFLVRDTETDIVVSVNVEIDVQPVFHSNVEKILNPQHCLHPKWNVGRDGHCWGCMSKVTE